MTDHDFGDEQDPLLVRPFVLQDIESPDPGPSTQTWPSESPAPRHAAADSEPTEIIPRPTPPPRRRRYRRRLLIIGAAGAVVVLAAAAAGFAALRPGMTTSVSGGPAGPPLPVVTGPAPSTAASPSSAFAPAAGDTLPAHRSASPSAKTSATSAPASGAPVSAGASSGAAAHTTAPATAQPHNAVPVTDETGTIRGQNGLCLDLNGGVPADDNHVQVFTCNNTAAQSWTLATDGTLRVQGMCALIDGDNTVHIVACDGRTTAQWRVADSTLINVADGECLTDPSSGGQSGTGVVVTPCGGAANQRWSLP